MPIVQSACPLDCPDACSLDVEVEEGRVRAIRGSQLNPLTAGFICSKVSRMSDHLYGPERVLFPQVRDGPKGSGRFRRVSWDEALDLVARRLREVQTRWGGEAILPCSYGGSNGMLTEGAQDARLFHRLGATNLDRTICAVPSTVAAEGLVGKMPGIALQDYAHSRLIVVWGCNPHATSIHLLPHIRTARRAGARLVVVDPRRTRLAAKADLHLPVRVGTDLPLALALHRALFTTGRVDADFLAAHCRHADALEAAAAPWTLDRAATTCGVSSRDIETLADWLSEIRPAAVRCGWGPERNRNGTAATAAILALPAVAGLFGERGGGYTLSNSGAWSFDHQTVLDAPMPPTRHVNLAELAPALDTLDDPPVRALFVYNCNPVSTVPHQNLLRRALADEDLFTVVHEAVHTDTADWADVLLPATTFLEHHELSRGYGAYVARHHGPAATAPGEARSNQAVFGALLERLGLRRPDDLWEPADQAAAILRAAPDGQRLAEEVATHGQALPPTGAAPVQFVDAYPQTPDRKVDLVPACLGPEPYAFRPDPATAQHPLALISPAHEQMITSTFAQLVDAPAQAWLSPTAATVRGIEDAAPIEVFNDLGAVHCVARVTDEVRPGVVLLHKGWWSRHTANGQTSTALVPAAVESLSGGACYNDARVNVRQR